MLVTLSYELCDAEGEVVEASAEGEPLEILMGYGEVAPALERALEGLTAGQRCEVKLEPRDGFGLRDPHGFIEVDAADLPPGLSPGDELVADREGGGTVPLKVVEVLPDVVVLDTNHPLAGQRVRLRVVALSVKPAPAERIFAATDRLAGGKVDMGALLPAERLLRRRPLAAQSEDEPPPHPTRVA
jgi:FKBP-type peptidyl-prolyl cis-trans isomerase SlyD